MGNLATANWIRRYNGWCISVKVQQLREKINLGVPQQQIKKFKKEEK